ncbi:hypothetical protein [Streptomyces nanshensis]|uniref:hypothetical protein n=1 Tax=Streptomyces nanshensis TaxID=518642 RepID=UPI00085BF9B3|nr:hypothetical protein [Streptomyces nanshensis]
MPSETRDEDEEPDESGGSEPPGEDRRPAGPDGGERAVPAAARSRVPAKPKRRRPVLYERRLASALPYPPAPPGVWRLERHGQYVYVLRNTTARTLTGVRISRTHLPASVRGVPENSVVRPGEAVEFVMAPEGGHPMPDAVAVSWDGQPGPASVPVPAG